MVYGSKGNSGLAPERVYWAQLDIPFREMLTRLPDDVVEEDGVKSYGGAEIPRWARTVRQAAYSAFNAVADGLDTSIRGRKAVAVAQNELRARLNQQLANVLAEGGKE